jgi:hypothetical protein
VIEMGRTLLGRQFSASDARRTHATAFAEQMPNELDRLAEPLGTSGNVRRLHCTSTALRREAVSATIQATVWPLSGSQADQ